MAAMKFACFLLVLLFTAWLTNALAHEAVEVDAVSTEKELEDGVGETTAAAVANNKIRGRKMGANIVKRPDIKGDIEGTSKMSSANQVTGKDGAKGNKGVMNVGNKRNVGQFSEEVNDHKAGFVAFNADYHAPRHHPPKNN